MNSIRNAMDCFIAVENEQNNMLESRQDRDTFMVEMKPKDGNPRNGLDPSSNISGTFSLEVYEQIALIVMQLRGESSALEPKVLCNPAAILPEIEHVQYLMTSSYT